MKLTILSQYHPAAALHQPRLWAEMLNDWEHLPEVVPHDFIIHNTSKLNLQGMPLAAMDTEKDGTGGLGQWSVAYRDGEVRLCVAPFYGKQPIEFGDCHVVFHNYKYDSRELEANGMPIPANIHDTMIAAYCLGLSKQAPTEDVKSKSGSNMVGGLGLKYLARRHLGMAMTTWEEVKGKPDLVPEYNANDSVATYLLAEKWLPILPGHYHTIDMPLLRVIMAIEDRGVKINPAYLAEYAKELDTKIDGFNETIRHLAFHTQDMQSYVYGTLAVEPWRFTDTGAPSVDIEALEGVDDPTVKQVLAYKELYKDKGTYIEDYIRNRDSDNRIHTELKQTSTSTGRLSSANPNLQNVPDPKKGSTMRKLFVAPDGFKLVRLDWKLIEFGWLAVLAKDAELIEAFLHGDIHSETAKALGVTRDIGKRINFLIQNGGSAWGMSQLYGLPIDEAKGYFNAYYKRFPALKRFHGETVEKAKATKKVIGYFGRERRIDALFAPDWRVRAAGEREAMTMPMQNGAAELVKLAMIDLHYKYSAPMILQVHDELLFEVPEEDAEDCAQWLKEYVPTITPIDGIEFPVEVTVGDSWYECCLK